MPNQTFYISDYQYNGPSYAVSRTVSAVMAEGKILPLEASAPNSSWKLEFPGPALRCDNVNTPERSLIRHNIASYLNQSSAELNAWGYLAWSYGLGWWNNVYHNSDLPFLSDSPNGTLKFQQDGLMVPDFYLVAMPTMFGDEKKVDSQLWHISPTDPPDILNGYVI